MSLELGRLLRAVKGTDRARNGLGCPDLSQLEVARVQRHGLPQVGQELRQQIQSSSSMYTLGPKALIHPGKHIHQNRQQEHEK